MSKTVHHVELIEGAANTTPWGQRDRGGVKFPCSNDEHLTYYRGHGRYKVVAKVIRARKAAVDQDATATVGKKGRTGPGGGTIITPERLEALANAPVKVSMTKKRLMAMAVDLGVSGLDSRKPPTNAQLVKQITERQALVLASLAEDEDDDASGEGGSSEPSTD